MLYFVAAWSILAVLTWIIGTTVLQGLALPEFDRIGDRTAVALWVGTVLLSQGLLLMAVGWPLSPGTGGVVAGLLLLCLIRPPIQSALKEVQQTLPGSLWVGIVGCGIIIAALMTRRVTWFDTGLYHYGSIRWLSEFGTVPGLALILNNFGFTSSWFALAAPFNPVAIAARTSAVANGFALLLMTAQGFVALRRWILGQAKVADKFIVIALGFILPTLTMTTFLSAVLISPSPDIPVIFLPILVAWSILIIKNHPRLPSTAVKDGSQTPPLFDAALIPLILATGAVSIKLSALPVLLIASLFYWGRSPRNIQRLLVTVGGSLFLLVPVITASIIHTGCPLYPSSAFCINVPWRISETSAIEATKVIQIWDHAFGSPPSETNSLLWQLSQWLKMAKTNSIMLLLLGVSIPLTGLMLTSARRRGVSGISWLSFLAFVGMAFIMLKAPLIRFGLGYFLLIPAIAIAAVGVPIFHTCTCGSFCKPSFLLSSNGRVRIVLVSIGLLGTIILSKTTLQENWLLPPAMPTVEVRAHKSFDVAYVTPKGDRGQCWDAPIPCTSYNLNVRLRNAERGLKAGFVPVDSGSRNKE